MGLFGGIKDAVSSKVSHVAKDVKSSVNSVERKVEKKVDRAAGSVKNKFEDVGGKVKAGVKGLSLGGGFKSIASNLGDKVKSGLGSAARDIRDDFKSKVNSVKKDVKSVTSDIKKGAGSVASTIKKGAKKYGPEALKIGVVVGAGAVGGALGGPAGAALAGGLAAGAVSAYDQKRSTGKIDPLKVGANTLMGAVPGGAGVLGKVGGKLGGKVLSTSGGQILAGAGSKVGGKLPASFVGAFGKTGAGRRAITGATNGASFGSRFGSGNTALDGYQNGNFDLNKTLIAGGRGAVAGALTGGAFGGIAGKIVNRRASRNLENPSALGENLRPNQSGKLDNIQVGQRLGEKLPVSAPVAELAGRLDGTLNNKLGAQYLGGTASERFAHVFGKKASVQTRKNLSSKDDFVAHASEQLAASPVGIAIQSGDLIGQQWFGSLFQQKHFLA